MLIHSVTSFFKKALSKHISLKNNQEWHLAKSTSDVDCVIPFGKCGFPKPAPKRCSDMLCANMVRSKRYGRTHGTSERRTLRQMQYMRCLHVELLCARDDS